MKSQKAVILKYSPIDPGSDKRNEAQQARILIRQCKERAKKKKLDIDIDHEWIYRKILLGRCERTGIGFVQSSYNPWCPSVDRIDSKKGYTKDNCQLVVLMYNYGKNKFTDADFERLARSLVNKSDKEIGCAVDRIINL